MGRKAAPPDLVYVDREIIGTYAARGAIQPPDDRISSAQIDMGQYRPAAVQQVTVGGFDDAVQTVLGVQDVAFATPPSPAGAEFQPGAGPARGPGGARQGRGRVGPWPRAPAAGPGPAA